jgi:GTP-binding protein EngB required for normal cell division
MSVRGRAAVSLGERLAALDEALALAEGRVPDPLLAEARAVQERAAQRRARGDQTVVVALSGGTGTGKSSLFNALAGRQIAAVDVRRPTTGAATAWTVGAADEVGALLDWLEIDPDRRHAAPPGAEPEGLVLLDLPDIDSIATANRVTAARLVERVDVLVWVVDPLKYAQRSLHEGFLARLREHADVMLVALNHSDRLDDAARRVVEQDLQQLVTTDGRGPRVLVTSAVTGAGVAQLRDALAVEVRHRRAVAERIAADVRTAAAGLREQLGTPAPAGAPAEEAGGFDAARLTALLVRLADVDAFAEGARAAYVAAARRAVRTLLVRTAWALAGLLRLAAVPFTRAGRLVTVQRTAPGDRPDPVGGALDVRHALLELVEHARRTLPWFWAERLGDTAEHAGHALPTALKAALGGVELQPVRRRWWTVTRVVWQLAEAVAVVGVGWILLHRAAAWLQIPRLPMPTVAEDVSVPGLLVAVGAVVWILAAAVRRAGVRAGARRHRARVAADARVAVQRAVGVTALAPLHAELDAYRRTRAALTTAAG